MKTKLLSSVFAACLPVLAQAQIYGDPTPRVYYPPVYWGKTLIYPEVNTYPSSAQIITIAPSYPLGFSAPPLGIYPGIPQAQSTGDAILKSLMGVPTSRAEGARGPITFFDPPK